MRAVRRTAPVGRHDHDATQRPLGALGLLALSVGTFTLGVDGFVLAGLLPQVSSTLHVSAGVAGQLTTIFALVYALGSPVIAAATGNWNRRRLLVVGMAVFAVGITLQAIGATFLVVAAGRVVAALGAAAYQATAYSTAGILSDDAHRARSLAVVAGGSSVAIVAGLPFGLLVGQVWGWRAAMWVLLALAVASLLAVRLLPPAYAPRLTLRQRGSVLADRRVLGILAGTVAVLTPGFLVLAYLPAILQASGIWVVIATLAYGAGQVAGTALVPRLIAHRGARRALVLGAVGVTVMTSNLTVTRTLHPAAIATMAAIGFAIGLSVVPQQHRLFATVPRLAPIAVGLNGSAIYVGSALGGAAGGLAFTLGGSNAPTIVAAIVGVLAIAIATTVRSAQQAHRLSPADLTPTCSPCDGGRLEPAPVHCRHVDEPGLVGRDPLPGSTGFEGG